MDVRKLRYFTVLAEEKHFGRAAKKLSLSQPPLSYAIKQLESELDARLFTRNTRAVELTPAGLALRNEAFALLRRIDEIKRQVRSVADGQAGVLRVGFGGSMLYRGLPDILADFSKKLPLIDIKLREMGSVDQIEAIQRDEIDLGFIHGHETPAGLDGFRYHAEPFVACLPATHRLAKQKRIKLAQLAQDDFVLFQRRGSPAYYESIIGTCLAAGFAPRVRHEVAIWLSVVSLVASGTGVALVPRSLRNSALAGAVFIPIDQTGILSETHCVWKPERLVDAGLANAIGLIRARASGRGKPQR
ncbi:HTH-type transcriptional regulator GltC [Variibacter gotjawalensis]|uniref:HTH-type transcriptional regulator GltC n=1 Tax=Variibacter gotjawalensis TaxID=1333996 RepID=A0A0S3Q157_9BRAD|nr:LysR family transcriptional regulator [Variibacter gotjawalensis]NIK47750.1 DNA-binding transcriptional LysR family regulator [Variibacter gotjawalensis]RZS49639.1 DNA-binding transcriptional LysR family regulator [Variibacter gotjawalensis]BAT61903.1 HTH-type transcriptional regulator GltC [Variibacter gotjawalensis]